MIMPLRYQVLHELQSFSAKPRQPVPQEFQGDTPEETNAFLESLVQVAHVQHTNFVTMLKRTLEVFNRVSDPGELGLDKEKFPFKIWRDHVQVQETAGIGKKKSKIYKPSVGEIIYVADENAVNRGRITWSTQKSNKGDQGHYAYFLNFMSDNQLLVQLSGQSRPVIVSPERVRACRGAAVLVAGPVKAKARINEKLRTDYKDEPYPAAASLLDIL